MQNIEMSDLFNRSSAVLQMNLFFKMFSTLKDILF